jgi:diguanylate cyclase (GGDEF)-like protein
MKKPTQSDIWDDAMAQLRRYRPIAVSILLVLGLGLVGLWAGHDAAARAQATHRSDRMTLQKTLAGLTVLYSQVAGAEILDILGAQERAGVRPWQGDRSDAARLRAMAQGSRALGAGAALVASNGLPVAVFMPAGTVAPSVTDLGWQPLRSAVLQGRRTLPVSGVLSAGGQPVIAVAVPVKLASGGVALVVGLSSPRSSPLQQYVEQLVNPDGRRGYVLDSRGLVIAGPTKAEVGAPLRFPHIARVVHGSRPGIRDVTEGDVTYTTSYAPAGSTGWYAITLQDTELFAGPLRDASRRALASVVLLLVIAGTALLLVHRKRETVLREVAVSDELTGLYNRRGWFTVANHEIERARRGQERRGLLFIDVDGLKQVNDGLGHREGDRAIMAAADVLRGCSRSSDVLGRLGGDEFVLLFGDGDSSAVVRQRVLDALEAYNAGSGAGFELRLSIGAEVWYPDTACSLDELVRRADGHMYADKTARPDRLDGLLRPLTGAAHQRDREPTG